jgi:hypothetical protein
MRDYGSTNVAPWATAPAVGPAGSTYFNTATSIMYVSDGTQWLAVGTGGGAGASGYFAAKVAATTCPANSGANANWQVPYLASGFTRTNATDITCNVAGRYEVFADIGLQVTVTGLTLGLTIQVWRSGTNVFSQAMLYPGMATGGPSTGYGGQEVHAVCDLTVGDIIRIPASGNAGFNILADNGQLSITPIGGPQGPVGAVGTGTSPGATFLYDTATTPWNVTGMTRVPLNRIHESRGGAITVVSDTPSQPYDFALRSSGSLLVGQTGWYLVRGAIQLTATVAPNTASVALERYQNTDPGTGDNLTNNVIARQQIPGSGTFVPTEVTWVGYLMAGDYVGLRVFVQSGTLDVAVIRYNAAHANDATSPVLQITRLGGGPIGPQGPTGLGVAALLAYAETTTPQTGITPTTVDLTGLSVTFTLASQRKVELTAHGWFSKAAPDTTGVAFMQIADNANAEKVGGAAYIQASSYCSIALSRVLTLAAGTYTFKCRASTNAGFLNTSANAAEPLSLRAVDLGP